LFSINTNGTAFHTLYSFTSCVAPIYTNSDGQNPRGLILSGNTFYGTTLYGGIHAYSFNESGCGTIYKINLDGSGYTNLHNFASADVDQLGNGTNQDGYWPNPGLVLSGGMLFGSTFFGGPNGLATVFAINPNGANFVNLHFFAINNSLTNVDGGYVQSGLNLSGNALYGTTGDFGPFANGTIFKITLPNLTLTLQHSTTDVILSWPTNILQFTLQSTTNLTIWSTNLPSPVIINGQNTVTNPITETRQFYQLVQ